MDEEHIRHHSDVLDDAGLHLTSEDLNSVVQLSDLALVQLVLVDLEVKEASVASRRRRLDAVDLQTALWTLAKRVEVEAAREGDNGLSSEVVFVNGHLAKCGRLSRLEHLVSMNGCIVDVEVGRNSHLDVAFQFQRYWEVLQSDGPLGLLRNPENTRSDCDRV